MFLHVKRSNCLDYRPIGSVGTCFCFFAFVVLTNYDNFIIAADVLGLFVVIVTGSSATIAALTLFTEAHCSHQLSVHSDLVWPSEIIHATFKLHSNRDHNRNWTFSNRFRNDAAFNIYVLIEYHTQNSFIGIFVSLIGSFDDCFVSATQNGTSENTFNAYYTTNLQSLYLSKPFVLFERWIKDATNDIRRYFRARLLLNSS